MDDSQFDRLTRLAAQPRSRRGALGVLAGLAGLGLGEASARKRRGKARTRAADTGKTTICHHDHDAGVYVKITVADAAWPAHQKHGDFVHDDCCIDDECGGDDKPCTASTCAKGTCEHAPTPGASCNAGTGPASGACDSAGTCQPISPNVCSGLDSPNPCFPRVAASCGATGSCHCGTSIDGSVACYRNAYCNNAPAAECTSNADCERDLGPGSVCFTAESCCLSRTGCTSPCPA